MVSKKEEVELPYPDEYEVVPLAPMRKLEKRIEDLEKTTQTSSLEKFNDKIIDMIELNQHIVDEVIKANNSLQGDLSKLIGKLDGLQTSLKDFIEIIKHAGEVGESQENLKVVEKLDDINKNIVQSNASIVDALSIIDKRLKRMQIGGNPRPLSSIFARRSAPINTASPPLQKGKLLNTR